MQLRSIQSDDTSAFVIRQHTTSHTPLQDTSLSFRIQPDELAHAKALEDDEPHLVGRMMLMDCERTMNVLSPGRPTHLRHVDLDTGAVVTEWAFKHEDHEVDIKDVCNNTAQGQLESATTFLGIGNNRQANTPLGLCPFGALPWLATACQISPEMC